ncbi:glycine-rich protein [Abeliophyllum distichum]|uniref:Glycine-rich protein n=1 Tax=Abeliophyllum distichum TaxID=126358 RepID=A0ABD1UL16_9LAMI
MAFSPGCFRNLHSIVLLLILLFLLGNPCSISVWLSAASLDSDFDSDFDSDLLLFHQDYTPPAPPPPPPHPPSLSCDDDLGGVGSLDTTCKIASNLNLSKNVYIEGKGNFVVLSNVNISCSSFSGCEIVINVTGNFTLGENSTIASGTFELVADNANFGNNSAVNTTGLAGSPPPQTSGTPQGVDGAGGGHGGRGAACLTDTSKLPEDVWGGDAYSWSSLLKPWSYGSKGGTTSKQIDYGGGGGGRVMLVILRLLEVNGSVLADGGDGGTKGGGGSGGSIYIKAYKMIGIGSISARGGGGFAGGGGGRVSVDIFSRHEEPVISVNGGSSLGCPENAGAAGTFYDAVTRSLTVSNHNKSTYTDTLLMEFPQPFLTNVYICNQAKASVPLLWSRVQVQGTISLLCGGVLSFGLAHYSMSEFELLAEELLMGDSVIRVFGALRMTVKMLLMWNSRMLIDGGGDENVETSLLEASNLIVLKESSLIHSNANLEVQGQGLLNLSGPGDCIEAQRLVLSLFYSINIGPGSVLRGPLQNASDDAVVPKLNCDSQDCPVELLHPPEDCNVNSSLSFTLQICRVEDILVEGFIEGSVVHFQRARAITVHSSGMISTSDRGCTGGVGQGNVLSNGLGSGGGHGGRGGMGCYNGSCIEGGISYGDADLPCELGSGSGNDSLAGSTAGGGILVLGSSDHPLYILSVEGSVRADGGSYRDSLRKKNIITNVGNIGLGGGSGGTILLFLHTLALSESGILSSDGGHGSRGGGGGGGGGRIHFHWSDISTGDVYQPIASVKGSIHAGGGLGGNQGKTGENGTVSGKACPEGLYGIFCEECPAGTYKNVTGSDRFLCFPCSSYGLPHRAVYIYVRGGVTETPCPYRCISERYHMPHCYTALEELIYTFGGPWLFGLLLLGLLVLLALVLSVARMKFIGGDELPGPAPTQQGSQIDHSFPFLESLNEVLETNRVEESQSHVHRMYFMGPNTFSEPWHLPHTPPEQVKEIVYEGAFNAFVDEINTLAIYQWWEGSVHSILCILAYPLAWSWKQWRRRMKLQRLREFVRSEYDHACLRSCRSRALYEGLKVAATPDLMLAYIDFFLGGDEKRSDLPPSVHQRFPMSLLFGGDGSYMTPFSLQNDNIVTSLMSQSVPPTTWYRFVAGLNAQLRLVRRGCLRAKFRPVLLWIETFANPSLRIHGVRVDLAWFQAMTDGYCHYGLWVYAVEDGMDRVSLEGPDREPRSQQHSRGITYSSRSQRIAGGNIRRKIYGGVLDINSLKMLKEKRDVLFALSFLIHNTKPVGHQDLVGLVISILLLGDFSLVLLTLLQLFSLSVADVFLVLFILPLGILLPFPAGINALFSHGPRRSAGLARVYALWNITSLINIGVAFLCGYVHYSMQSRKKTPYIWNMDESEWWIFPLALLLCKCIQSKLVNLHVANLEIQDRSLYVNDFELFWET